MGLNEILLICAAILPAVVLCIYIFKKDRVDKEPIGLVLGLFVVGIVICFPTVILSSAVSGVIEAVFIPFAKETEEAYVLEGAALHLYTIADCFIGISLIEEGLKFAALYLVTRNSKHFNSLFDGLIYAVFVSLGFAAFENVLYVYQYGWGTALLRAVTSVPGHMFFAVMMGYYYSLWHMYDKAKQQEFSLKKQGLINMFTKNFSGDGYLFLSVLIPILIHGLYDYCCSIDSIIALVGFIVLVIFLYVFCFIRIRKMSKGDMDDVTYSYILLVKKYPHLAHINTAAPSPETANNYEVTV